MTNTLLSDAIRANGIPDDLTLEDHNMIAEEAIENAAIDDYCERFPDVDFDGIPDSRKGYPDNNPKSAIGSKKPSLHAIPPVAILLLGQAMKDGKEKYGLMNWRENNVAVSVYYDAMMRHLMAFWDGEDIVEDSQVHHLGHVMACAAIILDAIVGDNIVDDRPVPGGTSNIIEMLTQRFEDEDDDDDDDDDIILVVNVNVAGISNDVG